MTSKIEYAFQPFELFVERVDQIQEMVVVSRYALQQMSGLRTLTEVLRGQGKHTDFSERIEASAKRESDAGFPLINSSGAVLIWGALECCCRDIIIRWIETQPDARKVGELARLRVTVGDYAGKTGEEQARFLLDQLERSMGASLKPGIGRFTDLLRVFSIVPVIDDTTRRDLHELGSMRNAIVHQAAKADRKLLDQCPWLSYAPGDPLLVSDADNNRYFKAACKFGEELMGAARKLRMTKPPSADPSPSA